MFPYGLRFRAMARVMARLRALLVTILMGRAIVLLIDQEKYG